MNKVILNKELLQSLYVDRGLTIRQISSETGISTGCIHKYLHKFMVQTRPPHQGFKGHTHTEEVKRRISKAHSGKVVSLEARNKLSNAKRITGSGHKKHRRDGYTAVYYPNHPRSSKDGYIMEHILIMEDSIGRHLRKGEVVHHINHNRSDNRLGNLRLMSVGDHVRLHAAERKKIKQA